MEKNTIFAALAVVLVGVLAVGVLNQQAPVVNVAGPVVNVPSNPVDVNIPNLGGIESGRIQFSNLGEGVLQSVDTFISSESFGGLDTGSIQILASSSGSPGTAGSKINQLIGVLIESNPSSEGYDNFRGFQIYVKDPVAANIIASASPFVALGSGSSQRVFYIPVSSCVTPSTFIQTNCDNAGALRNVASGSGFYLRQSDGNRSTIRTQGDTSFRVRTFYRVYETQ